MTVPALAHLRLPSRRLGLATTDVPAFTQQLERVVRRAIEQAGWSFSCQGLDLAADEIAAPDGLLPMIVHQAHERMALALGQSPAMAYTPSPSALCAAVPTPDRSVPTTVWALFCHQALEAWVLEHPQSLLRQQRPEASVSAGPLPVPLDAWYERWYQALEAGRLNGLGPQPAAPDARPSPSGQPAG